MTRKMLSILVGRALAATGFVAPRASQAADQGKVEQELMRLEHNWCNAAVKSDAAALSAILADDFTDVILTGRLTNKAQNIADLKTDKATVCDVDKVQIRVHGDATVVVGRATVKSATFNGQYMYTDTYILREGHWRCVASQGTEIKE
jgi:hypothetical protein